mmetsp:Transcript_96190/g.188930  ORF Transcript_96190/g.188930 Transcript_96190/m.188930 type:complete len:114 (-) Transcript_96190:38-379(-)
MLLLPLLLSVLAFRWILRSDQHEQNLNQVREQGHPTLRNPLCGPLWHVDTADHRVPYEVQEAGQEMAQAVDVVLQEVDAIREMNHMILQKSRKLHLILLILLKEWGFHDDGAK